MPMKTSDEILSELFQVLRQVHDAVEEKRELNACFVFSKLGSLAPQLFLRNPQFRPRLQ